MSKGRVFLFHWNAAEAEIHAGDLRARGWQVEIEAEDGARGAKAVAESQPDFVVIYHTRLPSHGRATGQYLAQSNTTKSIPIIFVGGEGDALQTTKEQVPGAIYVSEAMLRTRLDEFAGA